MSQPLINKAESFLEADEQYLVVIASCIPKTINPAKEPMLAAVVEQFPYADVYGEKRQPGTYQIVGDGNIHRKIILIFSQFYSGKLGSPNDSKQQQT